MGHINLFETENQFLTWKDSEEYVVPNVCYIRESDGVVYAITKTSEKEYKIYTLLKKDISGLTYNMVDLGLPSGTLWADRNVGATSPEDFGTYFAWGETEGYNVSTGYCTATELCAFMQPLFGDEMALTPDNIDEVLSMIGVSENDTTAMGFGFGKNKCFSSDWSDYFDVTFYEEYGYRGYEFNKYLRPDNYDGGRIQLQPEDDAATVNMGSEYRMPTLIDFGELIDNCTVTFIDCNGNEFSESEAESGALTYFNLKGIKFTGPNGNSIFIPASKVCVSSYFGVKPNDNDGSPYIPSMDTMLWSSDMDNALNGEENAFYLAFNHLEFFTHWLGKKYLGMAIRAVKSK